MALKRGRPSGLKGAGTIEQQKLVEMISAYNNLRHTMTKKQLKEREEKIYYYYYSKNVELAAPISMHLK